MTFLPDRANCAHFESLRIHIIESDAEDQPTMKHKKRTGYLKLKEEVELNIKGLSVWAYDKKKNFVGRLDINRAGIEPFVGPKGKTSLGNLSWETVFDRLAKKKPLNP